jgi:hypothetical protein
VRVTKALILTSLASAVVGGMVGTAAAGRVGLTDVTWQEPVETTGAEALIAEHGCWQGEAPADQRDQIPGHVVVSQAPGAPAIYSAELVDDALEVLFGAPGEAPSELVIHAFCG